MIELKETLHWFRHRPTQVYYSSGSALCWQIIARRNPTGGLAERRDYAAAPHREAARYDVAFCNTRVSCFFGFNASEHAAIIASDRERWDFNNRAVVMAL